ncbi:hypothetical protein GSI_15636 [Ganoderma sinense ZZ0214-1]|uniref:Uncharacterized protein n=1 Tax=Ganoderma sinense ZZ0214-1 TaxID=1077348 RepID=A0A2G8RN55_9APHY|nr:hypothetical protein GSI_15636 [Ganoderma sinense ZZ0214-1]
MLRAASFLLTFLLLSALSTAQNVFIYAPPPQSTFAPGESFVVDIDRPDTLTGSRDVSVAIGLLSCASRGAPAGTCDGIDSAWMMGDILYAGPYAPVAPTGGNANQNFTVTVPADFELGPAVLAVAHFTLVGELFWPSLEVLNETVYIQN